MKRAFFLVLAGIAIFPSLARAQEEGYAFRWANFSFEAYGGWSKIAPSDLNTMVDFEETYLKFNYVTRFGYYQLLYGGGYQAAASRTGDAAFRPITGGLVSGFRIRYALSPTLGLSLGVQFLGGEQRSSAGMTVTVTDASRGPGEDIGPRSASYENPGFLLGVSAWSPQIAAHFGWDLSSWLRFEALVACGPLFASCRAAGDRRTASTDAAGAVTSLREIVDMTGTATTFTGDLGARFCVRTGRTLDLFAEGSYAFREASELDGPGSSWTAATDAAGAREPVIASWTGTWGTLRNDISAPWGKLTTFSPQNRFPAGYLQGIGKFALNLSGFQVKVGLAVHL